MKKKILSLSKWALAPAAAFSFAALLFTSCTKEDAFQPSPVVSNPTESSGGMTESSFSNNLTSQVMPENSMIYIHHGTCFGQCPSYSVTVYPDGQVTYEGYRFVSTTGAKKFRVEMEIANQLAYYMQQNGFFGLHDTYPVIPDAQRTTTGLSFHGNLKVVVDYGINVPTQLAGMRKHVEKMLGIERYIYGDGSPDGVGTPE